MALYGGEQPGSSVPPALLETCRARVAKMPATSICALLEASGQLGRWGDPNQSCKSLCIPY